MKLKYTFVVELDVTDLNNWIGPEDQQATTIQEAATFQQAYMNNQDIDPVDILCNADNFTCTVEGVE